MKGTDAFRFDNRHSQEPSDFEIYFRTKGQEFRYTLSFDAEGITSESLSRKNVGGTRKAILFERTGSKVEPGSSLKRARVTTSFNADIPYLSFLALNYDIEFVDMAAEWIASAKFIDFNFRFEELVLEKMLEQKDESVLIGILKAAGINIDGRGFREQAGMGSARGEREALRAASQQGICGNSQDDEHGHLSRQRAEEGRASRH